MSWIKVQDEHPEPFTRVLVWGGSKHKKPLIAHRGYFEYFFYENTSTAIKQVTHWMPLPLPPIG